MTRGVFAWNLGSTCSAKLVVIGVTVGLGWAGGLDLGGLGFGGLGFGGLGWVGLSSVAAQEVPPSASDADPASDETRFDWKQFPVAPAGGFELLGDGWSKRWKVAEKHYFDGHGKVNVSEGVLSLAAGASGTGVVADFEIPNIDYELSFEARRTQGEDFFCGLTFPFHDQQATLILGGWGGSALGISNVNNFSAIENSTSRTLAFENGRWYDVRFQVTETSIRLWIDQKLQFDLDPEEKKFTLWWEQKPMAPLGLASWKSSAEIRRLRLKAVAAPQDEPGK